MKRGIAVVLALAGSLLPAAPSSPQEHSHEAPDRPRPAQADSTVPVAALSSLLARSDQAARAIERAVGGNEPRAIAEQTEAYAAAMAAVETYIEEAVPGRIAKDLPRLERALGRQRDLLEGLAERSSTGPREALGAALDASNRALEAVAAARAETEDARGGGHHAGSRPGGCGHH